MSIGVSGKTALFRDGHRSAFEVVRVTHLPLLLVSDDVYVSSPSSESGERGNGSDEATKEGWWEGTE